MNHPNKTLISARRDEVLKSYESAKATNKRLYLEGNYRATEEYIYPTQIEDAHNIVDMYYKENIRIISVNKKTKVGADGLMIEVAKLLTTHPDDYFAINPDNVRLITGMSNASWEEDMISKSPTCFKEKIFHHGKLQKSNLSSLKDGLIIIDEIDTGDKENQVLHRTLKEYGLLNVTYMNENNIRFLVISATLIRELYELYTWGELHKNYNMIIPNTYIGHKEFLDREIIKEWFSLNNKENAIKWIEEDIINNYGTDYRVHFVRVTNKTVDIIQNVCIMYGLIFKNHISNEKLSEEDINYCFVKPLQNHIVIAVKGLLRRANLVPNSWKLRIGATHELYKIHPDNNTEIQGLPGRMTGHWKSIIDNGHKTGPYRTSIKAITEYEKTYNDPLGRHPYHTSGFNINKKGKIKTKSTMLSSKNIIGLKSIPLPQQKSSEPIIILNNITEDEKNHFDNKPFVWNTFKKYNEVNYEKYKLYELHCWRLDTPSKCEKWGLTRMFEKDAYSNDTNIINKKENVLMIYLHENNLIISPWSGK
jgi:hypothetical protein